MESNSKRYRKAGRTTLPVFAAVLIVIAVVFTVNITASPIFESEGEGTQQQSEPRVQREIKTVQELPSFREVAQDVLPVVVEVNVIEVIEQNIPRGMSPWDFFFGPNENGQEREFERPGLGSGVIVRQDGNNVYVLTNNHVVGNADEISVRLHDEREFEASIVGKDPRTDLALIKFTTNQEVPIARLGDSDALFVGDWVLAVGNPYGFESTVTAGIVSAVSRQAELGTSAATYTDYIQTDASINPGNSGGALVNLNGEVVGINTWIASQTGGSVGIGFAVPINIAKKAINDFIESGKVQYGWLGVGIDDVSDERYPGLREDLGLGDTTGSFVINVYKGSPADKAGIKPGDYIVSADGRNVDDSTTLTKIVGNMKPGERVEFELIRYGDTETVTVRLEERPSEEEIMSNSNLWPGMAVLNLTDEIRDQLQVSNSVSGVVVAGLTPRAAPATAGFKVGDVITEINEQDIADVGDFYQTLNQTSEGEVMFKIVRQGSIQLLGLMK